MTSATHLAHAPRYTRGLSRRDWGRGGLQPLRLRLDWTLTLVDVVVEDPNLRGDCGCAFTGSECHCPQRVTVIPGALERDEDGRLVHGPIRDGRDPGRELAELLEWYGWDDQGDAVVDALEAAIRNAERLDAIHANRLSRHGVA